MDKSSSSLRKIKLFFFITSSGLDFVPQKRNILLLLLLLPSLSDLGKSNFSPPPPSCFQTFRAAVEINLELHAAARWKRGVGRKKTLQNMHSTVNKVSHFGGGEGEGKE